MPNVNLYQAVADPDLQIRGGGKEGGRGEGGGGGGKEGGEGGRRGGGGGHLDPEIVNTLGLD